MGILDSIIGFRLPGVARLRDGTALAPGHVDTLPLCEEARWGEERWQHGGNGTADRWVRCEKDASDVYAWQGKDAAALDAAYGGGGAHDHDADYVNVTGDTMTGDLEIDAATAYAQITLDGASVGGTLVFERNNVYQGTLYTNADDSISFENSDASGGFHIAPTGPTTLYNLAGTGTRVVTATATGLLAASNTLTQDLIVPTEVYGPAWNGSNEVPTKDALYDKIETVVAGGGAYTDEQAQDAVGTILVDSASIDLTYNDATPSISATAIFGTTATTIAAGNHTHTQLHDAVTVADSASIDLTLTGQQITASAIFGTTATTVAAGSHLHTGTYQPADADLTTLATNITAFGHSLVDDADAAAGRTTLGLVAGAAGDIWVEKTGDTMTGNFEVNNASPTITLYDTLAGVDEKRWRMQISGGDLAITAVNDAGGSSASALTVDRTGTTITQTTLFGAATRVSSLSGTGTRPVGAGSTGILAPLVYGTGSGTVAEGNHTHTSFAADITVPDEVYGAGWDGSLEVPTKNALYDKIQTLGGGGGTPGGSDGQVQFNSAGAFGGDAGLVYNPTTDYLFVTGGITTYGVATQATTINALGVDADTRISGDTDANLVFVDASTDRVGIGTSSPVTKLDVVGTAQVSGATTLATLAGTGTRPVGTSSTGVLAPLAYGTGSGTVAEGNHTHAQLHDAVTVTDTASIDLTLTGQQVSAAVIPGGISHTAITNIGTNTHAQIDTHLAATSGVHGITAFGATLVDDADAATARTTLGLVAAGTGDIWVEKAGDTMTGALVVPTEVYGAGWDGSNQVPTKDALYDKIQTLSGGTVNLTGMTLLETLSPAAVASISSSAIFTSTYDNYLILMAVESASTANTTLRLRLRAAGVDNSGANYYASAHRHASNATGGIVGYAAATSWLIGDDMGGTFGKYLVSLIVSRPSDAVKTALSGTGAGEVTASLSMETVFGGYHTQAAAYDAFTIFPAAGTVTGTIRIYGLQDTPGAAGSGAFPAGSDTHIQFNDGGVLGGDAGLTYNKTTDLLTLGGLAGTGTRAVEASSTGLLSASAPLGLVYVGGATFSASSAVNVNTVFSSTYDAYRVVGTITASSVATQQTNCRLRASAVDSSAANYDAGMTQVTAVGSTHAAVGSTGGTFWWWGYMDATTDNCTFSYDVINPNKADWTSFLGNMTRQGAAVYYGYLNTGGHDVATAYDGFSLIPASGTITGTVRVYGYRNS